MMKRILAGLLLMVGFIFAGPLSDVVFDTTEKIKFAQICQSSNLGTFEECANAINGLNKILEIDFDQTNDVQLCSLFKSLEPIFKNYMKNAEIFDNRLLSVLHIQFNATRLEANAAKHAIKAIIGIYNDSCSKIY